ncbi:MAG: hypothetical protein ACHQIG_08045, partial [Acidimicrobiia bacterium]
MVLALALLVASCSSGGSSSGSKETTSSTNGAQSATPAAFEGADAAVDTYLKSVGNVYVGDCADAKLPRDRGTWCSTLVQDGADRKVYDVGPVGGSPKLTLTVDRGGQATLTPGLQVDVSGGDVGVPRQLTLDQLLANAFITGNIVLDQQAGIGNGLADLPGVVPTATPGGG